MASFPTLSQNLAERHEALFARLEALTGQLGPVAARWPGRRVAAETRIIAETLLFDALAFAPRLGRRRDFPVAALTFAALLTQLGQALAVLKTFEAGHSFWDAGHGCFVWRLAGGESLAIARLRAETQNPAVLAAADREGAALKEKLLRRIEARVATAYDRGFADATQNRPSAQP